MSSCSNASNNKDAYGVNISGQNYIKLLGERVPMAHNPTDISGKTYKDSILIPVPSFKNGIVYGENIPVEKGYYNYTGSITINGNNLKVDLSLVDTDDKKIKPMSWNGDYKLIIR